MPNCTPQAALELFARTAVAIVGDIGRSLVVDIPYMGLFKYATFDSGVATFHRHVVQGRASSSADQVFPVYSVMSGVTDECTGITSQLAQTGAQFYDVQAGLFRGESPLLPIFGNFDAYKGTFTAAVQSLKDLIKEQKAQDIRGSCCYKLSGVKASTQSGVQIANTFTGGYEQGTDAADPAQATAPMSFNDLLAYARFQREYNKVKCFGEGAGRHLKYIGSADQIEAFRQQANLNYDLRVLAGQNQLLFAAAGGDKLGEEYIKDYYFEGPYRELMFAIDQIPMRANWVNGQVGQTGSFYNWLQPETAFAAGQGYTLKPNPLWLTATYEAGFLVGNGGFTIEIPEKFVGEGMIQYASLMFGGELEWYYMKDSTNKWGDTGQLLYQLGRAYRPEYPWFVLPIITQRCSPAGNGSPACPGGTSVAIGGGY